MEHLPPKFTSSVSSQYPFTGREKVGSHVPRTWTPADLVIPPITWFDAIDLSRTYTNEGDLITSHVDSAGISYVSYNTTGQPLTGNPIRYNSTPNGKPSVFINQASLRGGWESVETFAATNYTNIFALWKPSAVPGVNSYISCMGRDPYNNQGGSYLSGEGTGVTTPLFFNKDFGQTSLRSVNAAITPHVNGKWALIAGGRKANSNVLWGEKNGVNVAGATIPGSAVNNGSQTYKFYRCCLGATYAHTYFPVGSLASEIVLNYEPSQVDKQRIYKWMLDRYFGSTSILNQ